MMKFFNGQDFHSELGSLEMPVSAVSEDVTVESGEYSRSHASGWTITGEVYTDHWSFVAGFTAVHAELGTVQGNFGSVVEASSREAFDHFYAAHAPNDIDPWDI